MVNHNPCVIDDESRDSVRLLIKMTAAPWHFRSVCEEARMTCRFILKHVDYSLSISICDSWLGQRPHPSSAIEKKTVLRKVFSIRKVNKYSLLREKVL